MNTRELCVVLILATVFAIVGSLGTTAILGYSDTTVSVLVGVVAAGVAIAVGRHIIERRRR